MTNLPKLIDEAIETTIGHEGKYSNHPDDLGGETMWGIIKREAIANGYTGPMKDLPREKAKEIYANKYYIGPGFSAVARVYPRVAEEMFDTGVNMGQHWPSVWLQEALNAFNNQETYYDDITEDGDIGPKTIRALRSFQQRRGAEGERVLLKALNCSQGARYLYLARARKKNESFVYGWFKRVFVPAT